MFASVPSPVVPRFSRISAAAPGGFTTRCAVAQMACVDVPALPLQLLIRHHPDWSDRPVAVLEKDTLHGEILWVNERARRSGVLSGMSYATGLALASDLRGAEIASHETAAEVEAIAEQMHQSLGRSLHAPIRSHAASW